MQRFYLLRFKSNRGNVARFVFSYDGKGGGIAMSQAVQAWLEFSASGNKFVSLEHREADDSDPNSEGILLESLPEPKE